MKKAISLVLCLALTLSCLAGCSGSKETYAIKVDDLTVTENDYYRNVVNLRYRYISGLGEEDTVALWTDEMEDGATMSEVFVDYINDYLISGKLYARQFDELGLSFSETEESTITRVLSEATDEAGGMSALTEQLEEEGYTYEEYLTEIYDSAKKTKVLSYYFGEENGLKPVSSQDIKDYYNVHNARVKTIILMKIDTSTGEALADDELKEVKQKAQDAYDSAIAPSETDQFDELIALYSEDTSSKGDGIVISDSGDYDETLTDAALALEVGEVKLLDLESGYIILKRYDGTADSVFTAAMRQSVLETIRADEIEALIAEWKEAAEIKINTKITKKYRPETFCE